MFVNTLSQKTIEVLDSEARELLENAVTAAGESSYLKDQLAMFGEM